MDCAADHGSPHDHCRIQVPRLHQLQPPRSVLGAMAAQGARDLPRANAPGRHGNAGRHHSAASGADLSRPRRVAERDRSQRQGQRGTCAIGRTHRRVFAALRDVAVGQRGSPRVQATAQIQPHPVPDRRWRAERQRSCRARGRGMFRTGAALPDRRRRPADAGTQRADRCRRAAGEGRQGQRKTQADFRTARYRPRRAQAAGAAAAHPAHGGDHHAGLAGDAGHDRACDQRRGRARGRRAPPETGREPGGFHARRPQRQIGPGAAPGHHGSGRRSGDEILRVAADRRRDRRSADAARQGAGKNRQRAPGPGPSACGDGVVPGCREALGRIGRSGPGRHRATDRLLARPDFRRHDRLVPGTPRHRATQFRICAKRPAAQPIAPVERPRTALSIDTHRQQHRARP